MLRSRGQDLLSMVGSGRAAMYRWRECGNQKEGREKDKGNDGDETSEPGDMFAVSSPPRGITPARHNPSQR